MGCSLPVLHHLHIQAGLVCIFSPAQGRKMMIWIGFKRAEFFLQKKRKKCCLLECVSMKRMCKGQAPLFFMLQKKVIYLTKKKIKQVGLQCYVCIPLNAVRSPARCLWLNRVSIDPSELYHIMQSCCLLYSACALQRLCVHLLSVTGCFASAASFGFCLHAPMHSHCLDNGTDCLWMWHSNLSSFQCLF